MIKAISFSSQKNYNSYIIQLEDSKYKITEKKDVEMNRYFDIERLHPYEKKDYHFARCDEELTCNIFYKRKFVKGKIKVREFQEICKKLRNLDKMTINH